jgi:cytochrome c-type biogenesis protein CcmH
VKPVLTVLALLTALAQPAFAVEPNERLADPALEARARSLSKGLRCMVCQNESIDESGADLARDVRVKLRERLTAGDSDDAAVGYIVARYGKFVLLNPPVEPATYILWAAPVLILGLAGAGIALTLRRRQAASPPPPLDAAEQARLAALMEESGS